MHLSHAPRAHLGALALVMLVFGCQDDGGGADPDTADAAVPSSDAAVGEDTDPCADAAMCGECPGEYEPVPLNETPPLPGDPCADPPSPIGRALEAALDTQAGQADASAAELLDPDRITVITCGTGSPVPSDRAQACTAVFVGGQFLLFDVGDGAQQSMEDLGLPLLDLDAVFITHFHSDHIADLGEAISRTWILGRSNAVPVYGPRAIERVVDGFNLVYTADELYRRAHHGDEAFPGPLPAVARRIDDAGADGTVVYEEGGVVVRAYGVDHSPIPGLGFRVEYRGRSVGISGDTLDTPGFRALAAGADVLVSEVMNTDFALDTACAFERLGDERNATLFRDIRTYHINAADLGRASAEAEVGRLVLTHQVPAVGGAQAQNLFGAPIAEAYDGEVVIAEDGTRVRIELD